MKCKDVEYGTYNCSYVIKLPYKCKFEWEDSYALKEKYVSIDKCLLTEIISLWENGIKTTGCCCGHGKNEPFIGVLPEYIPTMKQLGYQVQNNPCRPNDKDSFIPKTKLDYIKAKI